MEEAGLVIIENQTLARTKEYAAKDNYQGGYRLGLGTDNDYFTIDNSGEVRSKAEVRILPKNTYNIQTIYTDLAGNEFRDNIELNITPTPYSEAEQI